MLYADIISSTHPQELETPFFLEDPVDSNVSSTIQVTLDTLEDEVKTAAKNLIMKKNHMITAFSLV